MYDKSDSLGVYLSVLMFGLALQNYKIIYYLQNFRLKNLAPTKIGQCSCVTHYKERETVFRHFVGILLPTSAVGVFNAAKIGVIKFSRTFKVVDVSHYLVMRLSEYLGNDERGRY